ncbi:hypothetical protein OV079_38920 [Nannocystis pusilla]|uniref:Uncharacterized protein n=1 Tax=Nannocystis pusilla TaxID=889268 RepID=A0A9X3EW89_9BACT|nr:hypothetical protein [Nannocystis pusilla]MCY1011434.1 hypothetical protein [Nannocystis pusilla]
MELAQAAGGVGEEDQAEHREGGVEAGALPRQVLPVADAGVDFDPGPVGALAQAVDHRRGEVESGDVRDLGGDQQGQSAGAAGDVEHARVGGRGGQRDRVAGVGVQEVDAALGVRFVDEVPRGRIGERRLRGHARR